MIVRMRTIVWSKAKVNKFPKSDHDIGQVMGQKNANEVYRTESSPSAVGRSEARLLAKQMCARVHLR